MREAPPPARDGEEPDEPDILRRVFSGTGLQVLGRLYGAACTLAALIVLADHLDGPGFGRLTYYLAVLALLDAWTDFGTGVLTLQRTAERRTPLAGILADARRTRLVHAGVGVAFVALLAGIHREPGAAWLILASLVLFSHTLELSSVVFKSRIAWRVPVAARTIGHSLRLLLVLALVRLDVRAPMVFLAAIAASTFAANAFLHAQSRRVIQMGADRLGAERPPQPAGGPPLTPAGRYWRALLPYGLTAACQQAYFYADNLLLRPAVGEESLGHYNAAVRVMSLGILVAVFASQSCLPWFTRAAKRDELDRALARIGPPLFGIASLFVGLAFPWTEELLAIFGDEFRAAGPSLRWLLGGAVAIHAGAFFLTALIAIRAQGAVLAIVAAGLVVNLSGNIVLIPRHGIEGAAMATFATEALVALAGSGALALRGIHLVQRDRGWWWVGGPLLFCVAAFCSAFATWF